MVIRGNRVSLIAGSMIVAFLCAGVASAQDRPTPNLLTTTREVPNAFGTGAYTVTTISATAFTAVNSSMAFFTSGSVGRFGAQNVLSEFYTSLDLPGGAVIDFIGLNSNTDTDFAWGVELLSRSKSGGLTSIGTFSSIVHGWDTDFNVSPIGYVWDGKTGNALVIKVQEASLPNLQFFGWVEVWWRRSVSPAPAVATFNDVSVSDPGFQYIEALAASGITAGCAGGNYCPDNPLTRRQMAVFLAKALGLHWPGN